MKQEDKLQEVDQIIQDINFDSYGFSHEEVALKTAKAVLAWHNRQIEPIDIEQICEKVHQAYCSYYLNKHKKSYWTHGRYSLLDEETKKADRYTVKAVLKALKDNICGVCEDEVKEE